MSRPSHKEQIVAAAVKALHRRGFNACSVQDLTEAAGVPKGSFYNHFMSKEDIAVEALERYWQKILTSLVAINDANFPAAERLRTYFREPTTLAEKANYEAGCFIGNMSTEMSGLSEPVRAQIGMIYAAWTKVIESCVREAQTDGAIRNDIEASTIAAFMLNSWEGAIMRAKVDRNSAPLDAFELMAFSAIRP